MSTKIWKSIDDRSHINKTNLSKIQLEELNKIDNVLINYIESLGIEQRSYRWYKTKKGYCFTRLCNQMKDSRCKSKWLFKVNVPSGQAEIHFLKLCDHI